jgi:hypothetical protein
MEKICIEKVKLGNINFFGNKIINSEILLESEENVNIPLKFKYNSSWEFYHNCLKCNLKVSFGENFDLKKNNLELINNLNSVNYKLEFLEKISYCFKDIELIEIQNVYYLNRKDFNYTHEIQRKSSISFRFYKCEKCESEYIGIIRIGYPLFPEKNLIGGDLGGVEISQINMINPKFNFMFELNRNKIVSP